MGSLVKNYYFLKNNKEKFILMVFLLTLMLLSQHIIKSLKNGLIITSVGPEIVSFIKLWGEIPVSLLFVSLYIKICNCTSVENAFRIIVTLFLFFFIIFAFVLHPNADYFHPDEHIINNYILNYSHYKWFFVMWGKWCFVFMYIIGDLWPIIMSFLFWQIANKIIITSEAVFFYPSFIVFGQINSLLSSVIIIYFSSNEHILSNLFRFFNNNNEEVLVKSFIFLVTIITLMCLCIHMYVERKLIYRSSFVQENSVYDGISFKLKLKDTIYIIIKSKYLLLLAIIVISYSLSINLIEGLWMHEVKTMYHNISNFIVFESKIFFFIGIVTIIFGLMGSFIIKQIGFFYGAIITPVMMVVMGSIFFIAVICTNIIQFNNLFIINNIAPLALVVIIGSLQNILIKGAKYSLYDSTKELAYIPLNDEIKTKSKAANDIICTKLGKSIGAIIQTSLFICFPGYNFKDIAIILFVIFVVICCIWIYATMQLSLLYKLKQQQQINIY